jgi:hypothetical protein
MAPEHADRTASDATFAKAQAYLDSLGYQLLPAPHIALPTHVTTS